MKLKTAAISIVVSVALVGAGGYGAYYAVQKQKKPVEVVPVEYVNYASMGMWGMETQSIYGSVTSQIAQTVMLNEEYNIDKIFVEAGDSVKEGTPLFSYDMTLEELELEMEQLDLQTLELTMTKLEKDLEKLKNGNVTASLEGRADVLTAEGEGGADTGAGEVEGEESAFSDDGAGQSASDDIPADLVIDEEFAADAGASDIGASGGSGSDEGGASSGQTDGLTIEGIETVESAPKSKNLPEPAENGAVQTDPSDEIKALAEHYELLVAQLDSLFTEHGETLKAEEVGEPIKAAVTYYRSNLADEVSKQETDENGNTVTVRSYELKEDVRAALGEDGVKKLEDSTKLLNEYHVRYVEMLIAESSAASETMSKEELTDALTRIKEAYAMLATAQQGEVSNYELVKELEALAGVSQKKTYQMTVSYLDENGNSVGKEILSEEYEAGTEVTVTAPTDEALQADFLYWEVSTPQSLKDSLTGEILKQPVLTFMMPEEQVTLTARYKSRSESQTSTYQLTIQYLDEKGNLIRSAAPVESYEAGREIKVIAPTGEELLADFLYWEIDAPQSLKDSLTGDILKNQELTFMMPNEPVTITARYHSYEEKIERYVKGFLDMADDVLAEGASADEDYVTRIETAIAFYQYWLAESPEAPQNPLIGASETMPSQEAIVDTLLGSVMENYQLRGIVLAYLQQQEGDDIVAAEELEQQYETLCLTYVRTLFEQIDAKAIALEALDKAQKAYDALGPSWQVALEAQWQEAHSAGGAAVPAIGDTLKAYPVIMAFQEYQKIAKDLQKEEKIAALHAIMQSYYLLTDAQRAIVADSPKFVKTMKKFGLWDPDEPVSEPETDIFDPGGWDDGGWDDGDVGYTAEELREMIRDKEREIKECDLDIREKKLAVDQKQRIVDGKTVKSTMDGTVISIGLEDGTSDYDYFVKVANESGLYAKGAMSELALEKIHVGDTISGMMTETGVSFTAEIKEISEYPDPSGGSMSFGYGAENSNASYYPFYARLDSTEGIEEGEAEIQLSATMPQGDTGISLETYFVREEKDGRSYVWKQAENGTLTKQYVVTGKVISGGMIIEIKEGLEPTDKIAFPYGKDVKEGAKTKEVDALDYGV